jgi:predicted RNase H-like nuclease
MDVIPYPTDRAIAGADGCKAGWVGVIARPGAQPKIGTFGGFAELVDALPNDTIIAVDMPIGLPDRIGRAGRGPEALVRRHLGERQSSVFSIPSRAAIHAETGPFGSPEEWYAAHKRASDVARRTSEPPRAISIQAFGLFAKIREIDALLIARPELRGRIIESHPEVAFWRLNGGQAMSLPKKIKGRVNPPGMDERRRLLASCGVARTLLDASLPRGVGEDDFLDATAMLLVAARHAAGKTISFPDPPAVDGNGIPIAIWA